jgi:hypothetical protein
MGRHNLPEAMEAVQHDEGQEAMRVLAALFGDAHAAAKVLDETSRSFVTPEQLEEWRHGPFRQAYEQYADELAPGLEQAIVRSQRELAARASALERRLLSKIEHDLEARTLEHPAQALSAVTKTKQTAVDKLFTLTQRPTQITETRNASEIVRQLEALRVLVPIEPAIEGTADDAA